MSERISIRRAYEPAEIDLWAEDGGALFRTKRVTRSVQQEIDAAEQLLEDALTEDARIAGFAAMIEARLENLDGTKPAKSKAPAKIIVAKWKADELSPREILMLIEDIGGADGRRPT